MTTTQTTTSEDLIIIWDDASDTSMMDFDFSSIETSNIQTSVTDTHQSSPQDEVFDFNFDISDETQDTQTSVIWDLDSQTDLKVNEEESIIEIIDDEVSGETIEITEDEVNIWETSLNQETIDTDETHNFSFVWTSQDTPTWLSMEEVVSETHQVHGEAIHTWSTPPSDVSTFDRDTILDDTIAKMQSRKEVIWQTKGKKQSKVDQLNEDIKALKSQVSDLEKEIKELEKEDSAIDLDISTIEKMKQSVLTPQERQRKPNLSNIKK